MLEIVTFNIEGIKGNAPYLQQQFLKRQEPTIICLQEHWLHGYECNRITEIAPDYNYHISCFDDNTAHDEPHKGRGRGGVATFWPNHITHKVKKLEKEERIIVIEIQTQPKYTIIINVYLPTMMTGSETLYREYLDKISSIIGKYKHSHNIILAGDLNGTLSEGRNNQHDKILKEFCRSNQISNNQNTNQPTFIHHNGIGSSQIDYILECGQFKECVEI